MTVVESSDSVPLVMDFIQFSIRIPVDVAKALTDEAKEKYRRPGTRNLLITDILVERHEERHQSHAPPITTKKQPARTVTARNGRKASSTN